MSLERLYWRSRLVHRILDRLYLRLYGFTWQDAVRFRSEMKQKMAALKHKPHDDMICPNCGRLLMYWIEPFNEHVYCQNGDYERPLTSADHG